MLPGQTGFGRRQIEQTRHQHLAEHCCNDDCDQLSYKIDRQSWQPIELVLGPAIFERDIFA